MEVFTFESHNKHSDDRTLVGGGGETWMDQADTFIYFLLAQGFIVTEQALSDYFAEKAEEVGDLRSNTVEDEDRGRYDYVIKTSTFTPSTGACTHSCEGCD